MEQVNTVKSSFRYIKAKPCLRGWSFRMWICCENEFKRKWIHEFECTIYFF